MNTTTQRAGLFSALHNLTDEIQTEKQAAANGITKQAEEPTPKDPGGYQGSSSHPSAHVDNHGAPKNEGARSSENVADVNADQGEPGVNKASDAKIGQQDDVQLNIGTQQSATGEDPSVEDDYKGGKEDPGTSHPAATDNGSLDGHKYANASIGQLHDLHSSLANGILADLANGQGANLTKEALAAAAGGGANLNPAASGEGTPANPPTVQGGSTQATTEKVAGAEEGAPADGQPAEGQPEGSGSGLSDMIEKAANALEQGNNAQTNPDVMAGYELAAVLGVEKQAAHGAVADIVESTINDAHTDADLFGSFFSTFQKSAMEGAAPEDGEDHSGGGDDTSGASDAEGTGGETPGGEGGGGGGDPLGGGGGSLGDALGGGSDPGGMMGGGEPPMGGGGEEDALMQLVAALEELGIPLEELAGAGGGMGGGMGGDPMGGGMPPMGGGPDGGMPPGADMGGAADPMGGMTEGMKLASAAKAFRRSGKYQMKIAAAGTPERQLRDRMKSHILELLK